MKKLQTILLVDDDETTNYINQLTIKKACQADELLIALNGKEALTIVENRLGSAAPEATRLPDLVLLDINMPVMDGFKFLEKVKSLQGFSLESTVVAILTTSLDPRDMAKVTKLGVQEFISKPLTTASLQKLVTKHFNYMQQA